MNKFLSKKATAKIKKTFNFVYYSTITIVTILLHIEKVIEILFARSWSRVSVFCREFIRKLQTKNIY